MKDTHLEEYINKANHYYELGQYQQSLYYWKKILKEDPYNIDILSLAAFTNQGFLGKIEDAKHLYLQILELDPHHIEAMEALADIYYDQELYTEAKEILLTISSILPNHINSYLYLAAIAIHDSELEVAINYYQSVIHHQPQHYLALSALADIYTLHNPDQAEAMYTYILNFMPEDSVTVLKLAKLSLQKNLLKEAKIWFKRVITLEDENMVSAMLELGKIYARDPDSQLEAEHWLNKALQLDHTSLDIRLALSQFYMYNHDEEESEFYLQEILIIDPYNLEAIIYLANILLEQERLIEAEELLRTAEEKYDHQASVLRLIAHLALQEDDINEAEHYLLKAIAVEPYNTMFLEELARLYFNQNRSKEAEDILKNLLEITPNYREAMQLLSLIYLEYGELEQAHHWAQQAHHLDNSYKSL